MARGRSYSTNCFTDEMSTPQPAHARTAGTAALVAHRGGELAAARVLLLVDSDSSSSSREVRA
jgi:hypothetical protein